MPTFNNYHLILEEIDNTLSHLGDNDYGRFANEVVGASRIFTVGKGRSGYVANSLATCLNQLGKDASVIDEAATPPIKEHDLLIIISGSGPTEYPRLLAEKAYSIGAQIALITTKTESKIGDVADTVAASLAGTKHEAEGSEQPLGSLFEQSSPILLDNVVIRLMGAFNINEETMQDNHINLE